MTVAHPTLLAISLERWPFGPSGWAGARACLASANPWRAPALPLTGSRSGRAIRSTLPACLEQGRECG